MGRKRFLVGEEAMKILVHQHPQHGVQEVGVREDKRSCYHYLFNVTGELVEAEIRYDLFTLGGDTFSAAVAALAKELKLLPQGVAPRDCVTFTDSAGKVLPDCWIKENGVEEPEAERVVAEEGTEFAFRIVA